MKKIILSLSFSLFLVSCNFSGGNTSAPTNLPSTGTQSQTPSIANAPDYTSVLDGVPAKIEETQEFNSCMSSSITMCIQSTAMQVAQKTRSTEFCKELKNSDQKESCTFAIVMLDVQEKGTIELCDSLSDTFKKTCINQGYRALALAKKDPTLCKKIPEPQKAGTDSSAPTAGMYNEQAQCIMNVIMSDPNAKATDCSKIQDASLKTMCETALEQRATLRPPQTSAPTSSSSTSSKTRNTSSGERNVSDF